MQRSLSRPITVTFDATPLDAALETIRTATGTNLVVEWRSLDEIGVKRNRPMTLRLIEVPAERVLELLVNQASSEFDAADFAVRDNVVVVSTKKQLRKHRVAHSYPIAAIYRNAVRSMSNLDDAPEIRRNLPLDEESTAIFFDDDEDDIPSYEEFASRLMSALQHGSPDPADWTDNGGNIASMTEHMGVLVVVAPPDFHETLAQILAQLHEAQLTAAAEGMHEQTVLQLVTQAKSYRLQGQYEKAKDIVEEAAEIDPDHVLVQAAQQVLREAADRH